MGSVRIGLRACPHGRAPFGANSNHHHHPTLSNSTKEGLVLLIFACIHDISLSLSTPQPTSSEESQVSGTRRKMHPHGVPHGLFRVVWPTATHPEILFGQLQSRIRTGSTPQQLADVWDEVKLHSLEVRTCVSLHVRPSFPTNSWVQC